MRVFAAATVALSAAFALTTPQDALGVAAARRSGVARRLFLEDAKSGKSSFELACLVTREASAARSIGPRALETMDELSRMTSARLALQSLEPSRSSRAVRVARAVAATVLDRAEGFEVLRGHADREAHLVDACLATRRAGAPLALAVADEIARRASGGAGPHTTPWHFLFAVRSFFIPCTTWCCDIPSMSSGMLVKSACRGLL